MRSSKRNGISKCQKVILAIAVIFLQDNFQCCHRYLGADAFIVNSLSKKPSFCFGPRIFPIMSYGVDKLWMGQDETDIDDETLLESVEETMLQDLCKQYKISEKGTKMELLHRLRQYADNQARRDREKKLEQIKRIEDGLDNKIGKEKYRLIESDNAIDEPDDEDELEGEFFFQLPGNPQSKNNGETSKASVRLDTEKDIETPITAPPPPPDETEANTSSEEKVVTVYSTTDNNDLTGIDATAASSLGGNNHAMMGGYERQSSTARNVPENTLAGGPFGDSSGSLRKKKNNSESEQAKEALTEMVQSLLALTGAPAFSDENADGFNTFENTNNDHTNNMKAETNYPQFIGFDPDRVPIDLLKKNSKAMRIEEGQIIDDVLSEFELQAIGHDGISAPDDRTRGGGHYVEVQKVRAFVEGYTKAETKRIARETLSMLLNKLVVDGVRGLDEMLMSMTKDDTTGNEVGELNDSLFKHLNEAIREQERKVELVQGSKMSNKLNEQKISHHSDDSNDVSLNDLWNATVDSSGNVIEETIDPNDERVKKIIQSELQYSRKDATKISTDMDSPISSSEQLLILLSLLRDRLKAEALFENDEKGKNLRVLAHCLHGRVDDVEGIIVENLGSSLAVSIYLFELFSPFIHFCPFHNKITIPVSVINFI